MSMERGNGGTKQKHHGHLPLFLCTALSSSVRGALPRTETCRNRFLTSRMRNEAHAPSKSCTRHYPSTACEDRWEAVLKGPPWLPPHATRVLTIPETPQVPPCPRLLQPQIWQPQRRLPPSLLQLRGVRPCQCLCSVPPLPPAAAPAGLPLWPPQGIDQQQALPAPAAQPAPAPRRPAVTAQSAGLSWEGSSAGAPRAHPGGHRQQPECGRGVSATGLYG